MKKKVLVGFDMIDHGFEQLFEHFEVIAPPKGRDFTPAEMLERIPGCEVLCATFGVIVDRQLLEAGKDLKLVSNYAVGYDNIDIASAKELGIAVTNAPDSVITSTAELAMALLLDVSRRVSEQDRAMRAEREGMQRGRLLRMGVDLAGRTVGILGYGNIGRAVATRCRAFGMNVLYNKRYRLNPEMERGEGIVYATKEEILRQADVISLHTPLTEATHHYIGREEFQMMKPDAILINTARGPVVDEAALVEALREKRIFGAGLDVFEHADMPLQELYELDNVVITPHVGSQTYEGRVATAIEVVSNVLGFINGDRPISRVV
ncbi:MAG: dihydrofolate reductase [Bacteroidetes bacterium]|nr:MAG: dihydrofolate reductase [Bacteroidota bacterium]